MKVAIYIRVSTEEQANEGYSISAQKQRLKAYCIAQDWDLTGVYVDEGISAKNMNRPQLEQMIKDIKEGKIDCVLVYRLDRLTRSVLDLYKMLQIFDKHNCKFKSATEVFETTTAMGRMFITIVAAMAQWERENLGERVRMGTAEKVRQGKYAHNKSPIGYDLDLSSGKLTIKDSEAKTIKLIFELYLKGLSAHKICRYLNERNITTKDGNTWNDTPLMQILKNPLYKGSIRWGGILKEDAVPPIVDKETFDLVQKTIEVRRGIQPQQISSQYIFSGPFKCAHCGNSMVGNVTSAPLASGEKKTYKMYRCSYKLTGQCNKARSFSEIKTEAAFVDFLAKLDIDSALNEVAATVDLEISNEDNNQYEQLSKELERIQKRKRKWQYAWANEMLSDEDFEKRMSEERKLEEELNGQLELFEPQKEEIRTDKSEILAILKETKENWNVLTREEKKNFVQTFIRRLTIASDDKKNLYVDSIDFY